MTNQQQQVAFECKAEAGGLCMQLSRSAEPGERYEQCRL